MKAQEVRVGNLVMDGKDIEPVNARMISMLENGQADFDPIPLTEERLVRLGATVYEFDNGQTNQYRIGKRLFVIRDGIITDYGTSTNLPYVHSLQNFIFAITGEELTTKTPIQ